MTEEITHIQQGQELNQRLASSLATQTNNDADAQEVIRRYGFRIGDHHLLVAEGLFCELLLDVTVSPLPGAPKQLLGLTNHRGNILPIYALQPLLGEATPKTHYAFLLGQSNNGAAIVIEDKPVLLNLSDAKISHSLETLPTLLQSCVGDSFSLNGTTWHTVHQDALFRHLASPIGHLSSATT